MANLAYQVTGFAYQGAGQFAYQGDAGGTVPVVPPPSGVKRGRKRELIVNLRDVQNRESTADFLKSQLRLRQGIVEPEIKVDKRAEKKAKALEALAMRNMEIERQEEQRRTLQAENNNIITTLLLLG